MNMPERKSQNTNLQNLVLERDQLIFLWIIVMTPQETIYMWH